MESSVGAARVSNPTRVAIVGGGCAGLTAAFELSKPEHRGRFEITVYQLGFRLGGKGASGRGPGARIEEHGLHVWMGFYENAFQLMRACYQELERDRFRCPIASIDQAFRPAPFVAVTDRTADGGWEPWIAQFPPGKGMPGDPLHTHNPFTVRGYLAQAAALVAELLRAAEAHPRVPKREPTRDAPRVEKLVEGIEWLVRHGQLASVAGLIEAMDLLRGALQYLPEELRGARELLLELCAAVASAAQRQLAMLVKGDGALRRTWQVVDLVLAVLRGSIAHGLLFHPEGFDAIDHYDWRTWLGMHGAQRESLESGFMRGIYDLAFAYEGGDPERPSLSAAAALRGAMRMFFTYRGELFWKMNAGMGDVVFAPLYELLRKRGVRFEFFHCLRDVGISPAHEPDAHVTELRFDVQAQPRGTYQPLVPVHGLPCWPARADYAQLEDGARLEAQGVAFESPWETRRVAEKTLRVGEDFDYVVLALGGAAMPEVCAALIERAPAWRAMARGLHSVCTQAAQLWLREDMRQLGFDHPPVTLSGWVEPFDTWADMTHLISAEASGTDVRAVAYFCSPLPDAAEPQAAESFHHAQRERVRDSTVRFVEEQLPALWPGARAEHGGFRWEALAIEPELSACTGIDTQFWTANVRPSDRYILSLPGTAKLRLSPLDRSFDNLTVAGDWTASGLNTGCVESAVMSGRLAAHALSGSPALEEIIGYDHP